MSNDDYMNTDLGVQRDSKITEDIMKYANRIGNLRGSLISHRSVLEALIDVHGMDMHPAVSHRLTQIIKTIDEDLAKDHDSHA